MINLYFYKKELNLLKSKKEILRLLHKFGFNRRYVETGDVFNPIEFSMKKSFLDFNRGKEIYYKIEIEQEYDYKPYKIWYYTKDGNDIVDVDLYASYIDMFIGLAEKYIENGWVHNDDEFPRDALFYANMLNLKGEKRRGFLKKYGDVDVKL